MGNLENIISVLELIKQLLNSTLNVSFTYIRDFNDIPDIDNQFLNTIHDAPNKSALLQPYFDKMQEKTIYFIEDNYLLKYIIILLPPFYASSSKKEFISIGPFLTEEPEIEFFYKIIKKNNMTESIMKSLKLYYHSLPILNLSSIIHSANIITGFLYSETGSYTVETYEINKLEVERAIQKSDADITLSMKVLENRYELENELLKAVSKGDHSTAISIYHQLTLQTDKLNRTKDPVRNSKNSAIILNTLCRKAAETGLVHPFYLDELSERYAINLEKATSTSDLKALSTDMIRRYCRLVQNYSVKDYSPLIRKTINYINIHLSMSLSLHMIANELSVNPSYLSSQFKKEIGITLTAYINKRRIESALTLLNTSDFQIQDIAAFVGIDDLNYFSRLFKKEIGMTPSSYKSKIHNEKPKY